MIPSVHTDRIRRALDDVSARQAARGFFFPKGRSFQTVTELRESLSATGVSNYLAVSLSTRFRVTEGALEYLFLEGWRSVSEAEAHRFFKLTNMALFEAELSNRPAGESWYAMISGHFPHFLVESLSEHRSWFQAVKVGSGRPIPLCDERFEPLWKWCAAEAVPVLLHCSGENPADFHDALGVCRRHPSLTVTLSHLGGMRQVGEHLLERNQAELQVRAAVLNQGIPDNLTFNNAVYDLQLTDYFCDAAPCVESRMLSALDLPFFGAIDDRLNQLSHLRSWQSIQVNTARYFTSLIG